MHSCECCHYFMKISSVNTKNKKKRPELDAVWINTCHRNINSVGELGGGGEFKIWNAYDIINRTKAPISLRTRYKRDRCFSPIKFWNFDCHIINSETYSLTLFLSNMLILKLSSRGFRSLCRHAIKDRHLSPIAISSNIYVKLYWSVYSYLANFELSQDCCFSCVTSGIYILLILRFKAKLLVIYLSSKLPSLIK